MAVKGVEIFLKGFVLFPPIIFPCLPWLTSIPFFARYRKGRYFGNINHILSIHGTANSYTSELANPQVSKRITNYTGFSTVKSCFLHKIDMFSGW